MKSIVTNSHIQEKALLDLKEFCNYLGIGQTKAREIMKDPRYKFTVRIGNRLYANKKLLDEWLDQIAQERRCV